VGRTGTRSLSNFHPIAQVRLHERRERRLSNLRRVVVTMLFYDALMVSDAGKEEEEGDNAYNNIVQSI